MSRRFQRLAAGAVSLDGPDCTCGHPAEKHCACTEEDGCCSPGSCWFLQEDEHFCSCATYTPGASDA